MRPPCLAPEFQQPAPDHRVFQPIAAVQIPGVAGAARTAARLMVRHVRPGARIIGLLRFPGDQTVLHIDLPAARSGAVGAVRRADRSEEHTSELQSLMRISYAVFCLKKKKIRCSLYIS